MEVERKKAKREEKRRAKALQEERKKNDKECQRAIKPLEVKKKKRGRNAKKGESAIVNVRNALKELTINSDTSEDETKDISQEKDKAICPNCGRVYPDFGGLWVACDTCNEWFDFDCTGIKSKKNLPEKYYCQKCRV